MIGQPGPAPDFRETPPGQKNQNRRRQDKERYMMRHKSVTTKIRAGAEINRYIPAATQKITAHVYAQ